MNSIGSKIRKIRELKGYSQEYMSVKLDLSQRAYSKIENDGIKLDWNRIEAISKILQIEPIDLVSFDDNLVFNNSPQSGKNNTNTINNNFPDELKKLYEDRISHLEEEVKYLRELLKGKI